jgi:hypothetical protein
LPMYVFDDEQTYTQGQFRCSICRTGKRDIDLCIFHWSFYRQIQHIKSFELII